MAQVIDELGRIVEGQKTANLSLEEIKQLVATSAQSAVGKATPFNKEEAKPASEKLTELFETYTKDFDTHVKEQEDYLKEMQAVLKQIAEKKEENRGKEKKEPSKKDKNAPKASVWKNLDSLAKAGLKKHSIGTHDTHCESVLKDIRGILEQIRDGGGTGKPPTLPPIPTPPIPPMPPIPPTPKDDGSTPDEPVDPECDPKKKSKDWLKTWRNRLAAAKTLTDALEHHVTGIKTFDSIMGGVLEKEREFVQDARKISYEIEGATQSQTGLMRQFENIDKTVSRTGKNRQEFIERYTKTLRMGIKDLKKVRAITIAQLHTEEQLGMKAGDLQDTFVDWARGLQMSEGQIAEMGRGMRDVARFTGLSGDALTDVVQKSGQFIDNLKTAGTSSTATVKNIIEMQANFKKVGIDGTKLMDAMTSTNKLLSVSAPTFSLLAKAAQQAGVYGKLFAGTLLQSKTSMKAMGKQFANIANQFGIAGGTAEELRASFANMSDSMKAKVNIQLKAAFDIEAGELFGTLETFENSSKSLADRLGDVNKKLKANLTLEEKAGVLEEQRKLKLSASMGALTALDEAAKSANSMGDALAKFGQRRGEFEGDMNALGVAWTSEADVARGAIQSAMDSVNKGLKAAGKQELSIDPSTIEKALKDPAAFRELTAQITKAEQEASTAAKAQLDPASAAAQSLKEINDTLRNFTNSMWSSAFNSEWGKILIWAAVIASGIVGLVGAIATVIQLLGNIKMLWTGESKWDEEQRLAAMAYFEKSKEYYKSAADGSSISVHDHHVEPLVKGMLNVESDQLKQLVTMTTLLSGIKDCICNLNQAGPAPAVKNAAPAGPAVPAVPKAPAPAAAEASAGKAAAAPVAPVAAAEASAGKAAKPKKSPEEIASLKAAGQARKAEEKSRGVDSAVAKTIRKKEEKNIRGDATLNKAEKKIQLQQIKGNKKNDNMLKLEMKSVKKQEAPTGDFDSGILSKLGGDFAKNAAAIAILAVGVVALGAAIIFLGKKILSMLGLDLGTVIQTAATVAAVAVAGGAIAYAAMEVYKKLEEKETKEFTAGVQKNYKEMIKVAAAIAILGPALVLLGAAIIWMVQKVVNAFGLDLSTVAETAAVVGAIAAAAGAIAYGVSQAAEHLEELKDSPLMKDPKALLMTIAKGGAALLVLAPAIVLLASAIVWMSSKILGAFGLDAGTAAKVAMNVGAIILAAGVIALGVMGASWGLVALGSLLWDGGMTMGAMAEMMLLGAVALLILTPAILLLAVAIIKMSSALMAATGVNLGMAAETGKNVAGVIVAAAVIAGAVLGAGWALTILGATVLSGAIFPIAKLAALGAIALLVITPAIIGLAIAILKMGKAITKAAGLDLGTAKQIAMDTAGIIVAAAVIAGAVLGAGWALNVLGAAVITGTFGYMALMAFLGAVALIALTPAMIKLASAIIGIAQGMMGKGIDPATGAKVADDVAGVMKSAGSIAASVLGAMAGLALMGAMLLSPLFWIGLGLMALGAIALLELTPVVTGLANAIIVMAGKSMTVSPEEGVKIAEAIASVIDSAGRITDGIMGQMGSLVKLGLLSLFSWLIIPMMNSGAEALKGLADPVINYISTVVGIAKKMGGSISPEQAVQMAEGVAKILKACADVTENILSAKDKLLSISPSIVGSFFAWFAGPFRGTMEDGVAALQQMEGPIINYVSTVVGMARRMGGKINPEQSIQMAEGVAKILKACADIMDGMLSAKDKLLSISPSTVGSFFKWFTGPFRGTIEGGIKALSDMEVPITSYIGTVVRIAKNMGAGLNPKQAVEMATNVGKILGACADVMDGMLSAKDKLLSIAPSTVGSFFKWITGPFRGTIEGGVTALSDMETPITDYIKTVVRIAKNMGAGLNPKQAVEMAKGVAAILGACADTMDAMLTAKDKLLSISPSTVGSFFAWFAGPFRGTMEGGVTALSAMEKPIISYITTVVGMAKKMGAGLDPKKAVEMAKGVAAILGACGEVTDQIMKAKERLQSLSPSAASGFFAWLVGYKPSLYSGVFALLNMEKPIISYISTVVSMAKKMGAGLDPKKAVEMAKGVAGILAACGEVTDQIMKASDKIMSIKESKGFWIASYSVVGAMNQGTATLAKMETPMLNYISTVVGIAKNLGKKLDPKQTVEMARGVAAILAACGQVTDEIMKASDKIMSIKASKGFWMFAVSTVDAMNEGSKTLEQMKTPMLNYVGTVVDFAKSLQSKVDMKGAKTMARMLAMISIIVSLTAQVLNDLASKITPLTQGGFFTSSPLKKMEEAKVQMAIFFPKMVEFISTIVRQVKGSFGDTKELKSAAKSLMMMAMILQASLPAIQIMGEKIAPLTKGSFFSKSPIEQIKGAIPQFDGFFKSVGDFVLTIIAGIKDFKNVKELKDSAKIMIGMALMLQSTSIALSSLTAIMGLMDGGFFTASPVEKIKKNKDEFALWFKETVNFVKTGILAQITGLSDVKSLQNAASIMRNMAIVLCATRGAIENITGVMAVMDGGFFTASPASKISKNKDQFAIWFAATAKFVNEGIVKAVINEFGDPKQITAAAMIMRAMAIVAANTVPVIRNLAAAVGMMDGGFFTDSPVAKISKNRVDFEYYFTEIGKFMHTGIVNPVIAEFGDPKQIQAAARIISAMAVIAAGIVPMIKNLATAVGLLDGPSLLADSPIEKIVDNKKEFAKFFRQIAKFMLHGIIIPILTILPDPQVIMVAGRIISALAVVITAIPKIIRALAYGLMPLMDSGATLQDTPADKLDGNTDEFAKWFTGVARFMLNGIVVPILTELPDAKVIMVAGRILSAMSVIIRALPSIIKNLAIMFGGLNPKDCLNESPIAMLASGVELFKGWFKSIVSFLREGIIWPIIDSMPTDEEIVAAENNLVSTTAVLKALPPFLEDLSGAVWTLVVAKFLNLGLAGATKMISSWFGGIAYSLVNGIINPIRLLPSSDEFTEIIKQLDGMTQTVKKTTEVLDAVSSEIGPLVSGWWWFSPIASIGGKAAKFGSYWEGISSLLNKGIIEPIKKNLPPSKEIEEAASKINALADVLMGVKTALELLSEVMMDIQGMGDMSALQSLPLAQLTSMEVTSGAQASIPTEVIPKTIEESATGDADKKKKTPYQQAFHRNDKEKEALKAKGDTLTQSGATSGTFAQGALQTGGQQATGDAAAIKPSAFDPKWIAKYGDEKEIKHKNPHTQEVQREMWKMGKQQQELQQSGATSGTFVQGALQTGGQQATGQAQVTGQATNALQAGGQQATGQAQVTGQAQTTSALQAGGQQATGQATAEQAQPKKPTAFQQAFGKADKERFKAKGNAVVGSGETSGTFVQGALQAGGQQATGQATGQAQATSALQAGIQQSSVMPSNPTEKVQEQKDNRKDQEASSSLAKDMDTFLVQATSPGSGIFVTDTMLIELLKGIFKDGMPITVTSSAQTSIPTNVIPKAPAENATANVPTEGDATGGSMFDRIKSWFGFGGQQAASPTQAATQAARPTQAASPTQAATQAARPTQAASPTQAATQAARPTQAVTGQQTAGQTRNSPARAIAQGQQQAIGQTTRNNPAQAATQTGGQQAAGQTTGNNPARAVRSSVLASAAGNARQAQTAGPLSALRNPTIRPAMERQDIRPAMERGAIRPAMERQEIRPAIETMGANGASPQEARMQRISSLAASRSGESNAYLQRGAANAARRAQSRGSERTSIESAHQRIQQDNIRATGSVATEATSVPTTPQARTIMPTTDIHSEVRQNAASAEPGRAAITSPELATIANAAKEEVDQTKQMVTLLEQMLKIFKGGSSQSGSGGGGRGPGDTTPNNVQQKPNNYYRWPTGNQFQQGAKQILNVGAGIV